MTEETTTRISVPMRTQEELNTLARQIALNEVFTDRHVHETEIRNLGMIFMPLAFGGLTGYDYATIGLIYEKNSAAGPRSINDYPIFMSCSLLHKDQVEYVMAKARVILEAIKVATAA